MNPLRLLSTVLLALIVGLGLAEQLELHFIDVGQGDAVLIKSPSGQTALYDGGDRHTLALDYLRAVGVEHLDLVIASHAHADHIGGLIPVVSEYQPRFFMDNGVPHTTVTYQTLLEAVIAAGSTYLEATRRDINLGDVTLTVIPPPQIEAWGHNSNSIGLIITYGDFRAAFTGDAEPELFDWWLEHHRELFQPVQVYKSSHHGSRNGDTREGIQAFQPEVVVIGVGGDNRYGHPHDEAMLLYRSVNATVLRTDLHGSIRVHASQDGTYEVRVERAALHAMDDLDPITATPVCVDINTASLEELQEIQHVGPAFAQQILDLRSQRPFRNVGELTRVNGIGQGRIRDIRNQGLACVQD